MFSRAISFLFSFTILFPLMLGCGSSEENGQEPDASSDTFVDSGDASFDSSGSDSVDGSGSDSVDTIRPDGYDAIPDLPDMEKGCKGTSTPCASFLTSETCSGQAGCVPEASCGGLATPCSSLSGSSCEAQDGCESDAECSGLARSCFYYTYNSGCISQRGCVWSSYSESCSGSAWSCDLFDYSSSCIGQDGCYWNEDCTGTAESCYGYTLSSLCSAQQGCLWSLSACTGTAVPCEDMPDFQCSDQDGCYYENLCQDGVLDPNEECDDGNFTDDDGCDSDCTYSCYDDSQCDDGYVCTDDRCDLYSHACVYGPSPAGTPCRPAVGGCDAPESCNGIDPDCPPDLFEPAAFICRPTSGTCDEPEYCTGASPLCPANAVFDSSTLCRPTAGECDVAEYCTGFGPSCPSDGFMSHTTLCRPQDGICDVPEYCTGSSAACPPDAYEPDTTACRLAIDVCDVTDYCTGASRVCPADRFKPPDRVCRTSAGVCDVSEFCTGSSTACPADVFASAATVCRASTGECDVAEMCTETSTACPENVFVPQGTSCDDGNLCTDQDACDNAGHCVGRPVDWLHSVLAITAGDSHTCALVSTGGVKCWGYNDHGQLGDGTTTQRLTPVDVSGLSSGVVSVAAGEEHTCALLDTGGVKCWGRNDSGQLGDGSVITRLVPVDVSGLSSGVSAIEAGSAHTCALMSTGGVKCWGYNNSGQLGDGTTTQRLTPVDVSGLSSGVSAITASDYHHTCALMSTGGVKCWGDNQYGQLGDGTTTRRLTPVDVSGLSSGVSAIDAGAVHTCALMSTGGVKCWGYNWYGQLGNGSMTDSYVPVDVSGLSSGVSAIDAGCSAHTCALMSTGGVKCWGDNMSGQVGDGSTTNRLTPRDVLCE